MSATIDGGKRVVHPVEGPEPGSREARASLAFKLVGVAYLAGVVLALIPGTVPVSTLLSVAFNAGAFAIAIVYLVLARGIDGRRPWAMALVRTVLLVLAVAGAYAVVAGFLDGTIRLPFELALAVWAFVAPPDDVAPTAEPAHAAESAHAGERGHPTEPGRSGRLLGGARGLALLAVAVLLAAEMASARFIFGWGGPLDVHEQDLVASLEVECGSGAAALPDELTISYDWRWSRTAPLPNEVDTVVVGWLGEDGASRPLYTIGAIPQGGTGIRPGLFGPLTKAQLDAVTAEWRGAYRWAIDLNTRGFAPATVRLALERAPLDPPPDSGTVTIRASYVHLDQWRVDAAPVTCTWP
jgi:hypothetical protein